MDLSNPEDVKALIPDHSTEILVHFGEEDFLERYRRFKEHLPEWRTQYPKLSSVDMRYERQVVLEMPPGSDAPAISSSNAAEPASSVDSKASDGSALLGLLPNRSTSPALSQRLKRAICGYEACGGGEACRQRLRFM